MEWIRQAAARVRAMFRKRELERDLNDEVRGHLEFATEENLRCGMTPQEAREAARREFGGLEQMKEIYRESRGLPMMETLLYDLRFGLRMLRRNPGFTLVAVLTLTLGIGANTAIFSVVNTILLRPLPYDRPADLVTLGESRSKAEDDANPDSSYPDYLDWVQQAKRFDSLAGYSGSEFTLTGAGSPQTLPAARCTSNFFSTLGIQPALGRFFLPGEDLRSASKVAILSYSFWRIQFASDPSIVGKDLQLDGASFTVVGVLPRSFEFVPMGSPPIWVPLRPGDDAATRRNLRWMNVVGRLKSGVTMKQAQAEMDAINAGLAAAYPQQNAKIFVGMGTLRDRIVGRVRPLLLLLLGAVGFVLLIACANVGNLLLARTASRRKEIAVRMALGAARTGLIRQFLTESLLLASMGGAMGLLCAPWCVRLMLAQIPESLRQGLPLNQPVQLDARVLLFAFAAVLLTGILFGLAPALHVTHTDVSGALKEESRGSTGQGLAWLRNVFVVSEICISMVLLVGAGLMVKSTLVLLHQNPGFATANLLSFAVDLPSTRYKDEASGVAFAHRFTSAIESLPGVQGVATVSAFPLTSAGNTIRFVIEGKTVVQGAEAECHIREISPSYFDVLRIRLLEGRIFAMTDDAKAPRRVIVNQIFANMYLPGEDPMGKRVRFTYSDKNPFMEIIGVVGNENVNDLSDPMVPIIYTSSEQSPDSYLPYIIRTASNPAGLVRPIAGILQSFDPELPMIEPQTMDDIIAESPAVFLRRYPSYLIGSFAFLAVLLATIGLYGLVSFAVTGRTREIGIRMALGASPADVLGLVVGQGMKLTLIGIALGVAGAVGVARLIRSLLFGVSAFDPLTLTLVAALLAVVSLLASFIPARRASRVDPLTALRYE